MQTPRSNRLHIGFFGRCNSGKSSLVNALTGRHTALVSPLAGTTTDPVTTPFELPGTGAVTLLDTAGFDDTGTLGAARLQTTRRAADKCDTAVVVCAPQADYTLETEWVEQFRRQGAGVVVVATKSDTQGINTAAIAAATGIAPIAVSTTTGEGLEELMKALTEVTHNQNNKLTITGNLAKRGDLVVLVLPQDSGAPAGRLILPQSQTLRELLDKGCAALCCTPQELEHTLARLTAPPQLMVTDSQTFPLVASLCPAATPLTSFSILFARYKGDLPRFIEGAQTIGRLTEGSRVLIAEACAHAPSTEDIGRVKLPRLLRQRVGEGLQIDVVAGDDFPDDLTPYALVIHCGGCMFNRRHVLSRAERASAQGVAITNYGVVLAYLGGILERVVFPISE